MSAHKIIHELEMRIARQLVLDLLAAGFSITVNDGEEDVLPHATDVEAILKAMASTDGDVLVVHKPRGKLRGDGWVRFIYGSDGWDVINDYTTNLEPHMAGANAISQQYAD